MRTKLIECMPVFSRCFPVHFVGVLTFIVFHTTSEGSFVFAQSAILVREVFFRFEMSNL